MLLDISSTTNISDILALEQPTGSNCTWLYEQMCSQDQKMYCVHLEHKIFFNMCISVSIWCRIMYFSLKGNLEYLSCNFKIHTGNYKNNLSIG